MTKKKFLGKKGAMEIASIISLVAGIGVAVMILILSGSLSGSTYELVEDDIAAIGNNRVVNESFTAKYATSVTLNHGFLQTSTLKVVNTTGANIGTGNFTIGYDAGTLKLKASTLENKTLKITYTWGAKEIRESVQGGVIAGFKALETTGDYLPIIVLAVVIAMVLGLVLGMGAVGGGSGGVAL